MKSPIKRSEERLWDEKEEELLEEMLRELGERNRRRFEKGRAKWIDVSKPPEQGRGGKVEGREDERGEAL